MPLGEGGGGRMLLPYMAHTGMYRWTRYMGFVLSVLNRVFNFLRVCPNYKRGISCPIDSIFLMKFFFTSA